MSKSYYMLQFLKKERLKNQQKVTSVISNDTEMQTERNIKCRICLQAGTIPLFHSEISNIADAIRTFCEIECSETDGYPKHLCTSCHSFLNKAVAFRKTAQETDKFLRKSTLNETEDYPDPVGDPAESLDNDFECDVKAPNPNNCKPCKLNLESFDELATHKKSKPHKKIRVQCPLCYRLLTAQLYKKHVARHQSASHLVCDVCGKLYRKDNLVRHLQLHSFDLPFQCQVCPYRGRFMESLKIHMRTHTGNKPFSCDKCELRFLTRSNLNRHLLTHKKDRPFKCIECSRGFYTKRDMEIHFKADHAGQKEFSCRICGNKYGTRKALMRHELRVHKRDKMAKGRMPLYLQAGYQKQDELLE